MMTQKSHPYYVIWLGELEVTEQETIPTEFWGGF